MLEALQQTQQQDSNPPAQQSDSMPVPRTQVKMLTDDGIQKRDVTVSPMEETTETPETPVSKEQTDTEQDQTLQAMLDAHDAAQTETSQNDGTADNAPERSDTPNFDAPEMAKLAEDFKAAMGIDLKQAYETFVQAQTQLTQFQEQQQQAELQRTVDSLKSDWGVNDAEFNTRVAAVLDYANKLDPKLRQAVDNPEGIKMLWSQVEKRQAKSGSAPTSKATPVSGNNSGPTFRKSELYAMMRDNPALYNSRQAEIQRAFETGRVIDDI